MKKLIAIFIVSIASLIFVGQAAAATINLSSDEWLGELKLDKKQLTTIKSAVEKALNAPIDAEQQCGEVRLDCVVRAAREWTVDGDKYREIVIHIHTVGHASRAVGQDHGKWPAVAAN
ncbi:MAG: hypothetical protein R3240_03460 [Gammaproteobacteria bacterium]|nr:hypothetical protein [Gammaproteobacteria bacterium]